jgi:1,2-diacylglycerol 3-alpha-glucosyltransferase
MIYNLGLGFRELGHNVTLVAASEYKPVKEEKYEFEVVFLPSVMKKILPPSVLPFQPELWRFLKKNKNKFDIIISSEVFAFPSLLASIIAPEKTVVWQELAVHNRKMKGIPSHFWYNVMARLFFRKTPIIARSESAKIFISRYLKNVAEETVEHGVNLQKFNFSKNKKRQFIVVSQLIARKNIESIIEKFSRFIAKPEYADFQLIIAGCGELENKLKAQVKELNITNNVQFIGFKPHSELNILVAESMAMLIDTKQDLNMVSVPESVVSGTPVLINLVPYTAVMIEKHQLGIAKTNWNENDLQDIVENNTVYVENCIAFREKLSTKSTAEELIKFKLLFLHL